MAAQFPTYSFKLVLLGDSAVGKSSIVFRFVRNRFQEQMEATIGAAFVTQSIELYNSIIKYEIWDTAGQERYATLAPMYYRAAPAAVVVYDVTNAATFRRAKEWVEELRANGAPGCVIALAGNKCDLSEARAVSYGEGYEYAKQRGLIWVETSAKTGDGVYDLFVKIAGVLPKGDYTKEKFGVFDDLEKDPNQKGKVGCC